MYRTIIPAFLLAITTQAYAGALIVQSDHPEPIVVTVDGTVSGSTPIEIRNLQPGSHDVGYRVGNFARDSFTEKVDVPQDGDVTVFVDLPKRRSTIVYVDPPKKEPAPPPIESTVTTAPQFSSTSGPAGDLYVLSEGTPARVFVDGVDSGEMTPAMIKGVKPGKHQVELRTECARAEQQVDVQQDRIARAELNPLQGQGTVAINTSPKGATVWLDGEDVGQTPYKLEGTCGTHQLEITNSGYFPIEQELQLVAYEEASLQIDLEKETFGTLVISVEPFDAHVAIDGIEVSQGPTTLDRIVSGPHELTVSMSGFVTHQANLSIIPDELTRLDLVLEEGRNKRSKSTKSPSSSNKSTASTKVPREKGERTGPAAPRIVLNTLFTAGGVGASSLAIARYANLRGHYSRYLAHDSDEEAARIYDTVIVPQSRQMIIEGIVGGVLMASSTALWATTKYKVSPTTNGVAISGKW
ncbi:MAG: PEGA domain-containing protein [Proteobacteria bacterium]|nr:PEGA domain-containing protein [Pseudomonadota bacterium]